MTPKKPWLPCFADVRLLQIVCLVVLFTLPLVAQSPNGTINGLVLDPSNRVIVAADILVITT